MAIGGVSQMAVDGEKGVFSTPARNGEDAALTAEVVVASNGKGSSAVATAPVWQIGQRVKQDERGEGISAVCWEIGVFWWEADSQ